MGKIWQSKVVEQILINLPTKFHLSVVNHRRHKGSINTNISRINKLVINWDVEFDENIAWNWEDGEKVERGSVKVPQLQFKNSNTARRETITKKKIKLKYYTTEEQLADIFTKALPRPRFEMLRSKLGVIEKELYYLYI